MTILRPRQSLPLLSFPLLPRGECSPRRALAGAALTWTTLALLLVACGDDSPMPAAGDARVALACSDTIDAVYTAPADLPPHDPSRRGDVVRCAFDRELAPAALDATLTALGHTMPDGKPGECSPLPDNTD